MASSASLRPFECPQREAGIRAPPGQGNQYSDISAGGQARQHNGNVYNTNTNHYTIRQRRSDEELRENDLNKRFLKAAAEGQTRRLEVLHQIGGTDTDFTDDYGMTPLHHACFAGYEDTVETLLRIGADVNAYSDVYGTPLCLAALKGRQRVIDILIDGRASIYADGGLLGSALHAACAGGNVLTAEKLIELGYWTQLTRRYCLYLMNEALYGRFTKTGFKFYAEGEPLHVATGAGELNTVNFLLSKEAKVNASWRSWVVADDANCAFENADPTQKVERDTALILAASKSYWGILQTLLHHGASPDFQHSNGMTALMEAAYRGHVQCVTSLIDAGVNTAVQGRQGYTAAMCAAQQGHAETLKELVQAGAPLDSQDNEGNTAFSIAAYNGVHPGEQEQERDGNTPIALHWAAKNGHSEVISFLLDNGAPLEAKALDKRITAISLAAVHDHARGVEILLHRGADVATRDENHGFTPLHWAAQYGRLGAVQAVQENQPAVVRALLAAGADAQAPDNDEFTSLHWAARAGNVDMVRALVDAGGDLDAMNIFGATPLMEAAFEGQLQVVEEMVTLGANLSLEDDNGETALVIADKNGNADIAKVLDEAIRQTARTHTQDSASQKSSASKRNKSSKKTTTGRRGQSSRKTNAQKENQDDPKTTAKTQGSNSRRPKRPTGWFW